MNKKFSIAKTIDLNKLHNEIDEYIMQTGETDLNLFMHIDTMNVIYKTFLSVSLECHLTTYFQNAIGYWEGYKICIDNGLAFGEIEIRPTKCQHEWHTVGSVAGTKARYTVHVCSKCGAQQTQRQVFNKKDGTYKIYVLDDKE